MWLCKSVPAIRSGKAVLFSRYQRSCGPSSGRLHHVSAGPSVLLGRHVREALANGCPVVALESTVITHGLPEPQNLELALQLEREIADGLWWRDGDEFEASSGRSPKLGAVVPATVGIVKGQLIVGLSREQLEYLASSKLSQPIKASRRDIPVAQALGLSAGTTVSATMAIATSCGGTGARISVFATGGLGGVHSGGELSMDVSADLYEMARSPMGLVSSGFKSFLDTRRSLELLETLGCTVLSLSPGEQIYTAGRRQADARREDDSSAPVKARTSQLFPGFFTTANKERVRSPWQCDDVQEAARVLYHCLLGPGSGPNSGPWPTTNQASGGRRAMLLACPIPGQSSLDARASEEHCTRELLDRISAEIDKRPDLSGAEKTPLILAELSRRSGGRTLAANLELLRNNARVGAHLAYEHAGLCQRAGGSGLAPSDGAGQPRGGVDGGQPAPDPARPTGADWPARKEAGAKRSGSPLVVGCTMIDMHVRTEMDARFRANPAHSGVTFAGQPRMVLGGVGRNLAAALELLGHEPTFVTSLARDNLGEFARAELGRLLAAGGSAGRPRAAHRLEVVEWDGLGGRSSSCFALVLIDALTGLCEFVVADVEARRALSRGRLEGLRLEALMGAPAGRPPLLVLDANLPGETIEYLLELGHRWRVEAFLEPTDVACLPELAALVARLTGANPAALGALAYLSPNVIELQTLLGLFRSATGSDAQAAADTDGRAAASPSVDQVRAMARELMEAHMPTLKGLLVTMDRRGVLVGLRAGPAATEASIDAGRLAAAAGPGPAPCSPPVFKHFPVSEPIESPVSASGAGDCFAAGFISGLIKDLHLAGCVELGFRAATCALMDTRTVPESLAGLGR